MKLVDYTTAGVHMYCLQYWDDCHPENPKSTKPEDQSFTGKSNVI